MNASGAVALPPFSRFEFGSGALCTRIGTGGIGGKAAGLLQIHDAMQQSVPDGRIDSIRVGIPRFVVIGTDVFDAFLERNQLGSLGADAVSDERIAHAFQRGELPAEIVGDLRALIEEFHAPLAVRSSSLLEDALERPFAGVYETKMTPNHAPAPDDRFRRLVEAIKYVYASTYFSAARSYRRACGIADSDEKMAIVLQEVVGRRYNDRYYPHVSAVCRSYSYYPVGRALPKEGYVALALGLGKTIVDGGLCWSYSPAHPRTPPPFASAREMLRATQTTFWAVRMDHAPVYDPVVETEFLVQADLAAAEYDGVLGWCASSYDAQSDRIRSGIASEGARVLDFAPLLKDRNSRFNDAIKQLLAIAEGCVGGEVEIELAMVAEGVAPEVRMAVLQMRPMMAPHEIIDLTADAGTGEPLVGMTKAIGNGAIDDLYDVVYLKPDAFQLKSTRVIARDLQEINGALLEANRPYLLIGFGRWGSADPWLGVPVTWGQVAGARVMVEASLPGVNVEPSQGSHFFHNLSSLGVPYFTAASHDGIDWEYLERQTAIRQTEFVRHVHLDSPLRVRVDGRSGKGLIQRL